MHFAGPRQVRRFFKAAAAAGFRGRLGRLAIVARHVQEHADIVHAHDARAHTLAAIAARAPFVVSRRVAFPVKRSLLSQWKYRQAKRYLAVSQFVGA